MSAARVRRPGMIQVHGVTTEHDVIWQIGNGPKRVSTFEQVKHFREAIGSYHSGVAGMLCEGSVEYVNADDLDRLDAALKRHNRCGGHPLCLSCHRASVVLGLDVCSGCNDGAELRDAREDYWFQQRYDDAVFAQQLRDEPRRIEPDHAWIADEAGPWTDEHGIDRTPGQFPIGGAL